MQSKDAAVPAALIRVVGKMNFSFVSVNPEDLLVVLPFAFDLSDRNGSQLLPLIQDPLGGKCGGVLLHKLATFIVDLLDSQNKGCCCCCCCCCCCWVCFIMCFLFVCFFYCRGSNLSYCVIVAVLVLFVLAYLNFVANNRPDPLCRLLKDSLARDRLDQLIGQVRPLVGKFVTLDGERGRQLDE